MIIAWKKLKILDGSGELVPKMFLPKINSIKPSNTTIIAIKNKKLIKFMNNLGFSINKNDIAKV